MTDSAQRLRILLADELRAALLARDREMVSTIRSVTAALDNAGAVPQTEVPAFGSARPAEVPRKRLDDADVVAILTAEMAERSSAADEYEALGQPGQAKKFRDSVAAIRRWLAAWLS